MSKAWERVKRIECKFWSYRFLLIWASLLTVFCFITLQFVWLLRPYDDFSYGEPGPIQTEEFTSEGVPVIRVGLAPCQEFERLEFSEDAIVAGQTTPLCWRGSVQWTQPFCNHGVNTTSQRWIDIYGEASSSGFARTTEDLEQRPASFGIDPIQFYSEDVGQNECGDAIVFAILPVQIPVNGYYRLRIETSYEANPIRDPVAHTETELFLLLPLGAEIP